MKSIATPRPWPPDLGKELRKLFSRVSKRLHERERAPCLDLKMALDEVDMWLQDRRDYQGRWRRRPEWESLINDLAVNVGKRGGQLQSLSPDIDKLRSQLHRDIGPDKIAKESCLRTSAAARAELAEPAAAVAAFDDLVTALRRPGTGIDIVEDRMRMLEAVLRFADRTLTNNSQLLAGLADNCAWNVAVARYVLDGVELPDDRRIFSEDAGLTLNERIDLCRRLIRQVTSPGHHVIWIVYGNARFDPWRFELGPVTFFDGPALLGTFDRLTDGPPDGVPEELLNGVEGKHLREKHQWPYEEFWVAARVDLGQCRYADPVRVARNQADGLVALAAFHAGDTSWQHFQGHLHIVDGVLRSGLYPFTLPMDEETWVVTDHTDDLLHELRPDLAAHLPVDEPHLGELVDTAATLQATSATDDSTALVQDARIIELLATRCGITDWRELLNEVLAVRWARHQIMRSIHEAVESVCRDPELRKRFSHLEDLMPKLMTHEPHGAVLLHHDVALDALPELANLLPDHHLQARHLRTIAARVGSTTDLDNWVTELLNEHRQLVQRLARCRNSLAHGGPINPDTAATLRCFADQQAKSTTYIGLWGLLTGTCVQEAHDTLRDEENRWRNKILGSTTVKDAVLGS